MTGFLLFACLLGLMNAVGFVLVWIKMHKPHEDPRLSRGLQLMQTKMSVLEDLSDRIDTQASQLFAILESKRMLTDDLVKRSNENHQRLEELITHGTQALRAFDSQNPIEAMVKEKNTEKLNRARTMIDSGYASHDVSHELGLSRAEVDFIEQMKRPGSSVSTPHPAPSSPRHFPQASGGQRMTSPVAAAAAPPAPVRVQQEYATSANSGLQVEIQRVQFPRITSHSL